MECPRVGVMITSKDRCELVRKALRETLRQTYEPMEILVLDDGSTDGTAEMLAAEFPFVRVARNEKSLGYIHNRNHAADLLSDCRYIISLDDDSWMLEANAIWRIVEIFQAHPDTAALSLEVFTSWHLPLPPDPLRDGLEIASFVGCGYAVDRERFIELGRFPEYFEFYGEESDFVLRVMDSAWTCRFASVGVYHAVTQTGRNRSRIIRYALANSLTMYCVREPWFICIPHCVVSFLRSFVSAVRRKETRAVFEGLRTWLGRWRTILRERRAIKWSAFQKHTVLRREWAVYFEYRQTSSEPRRDIGLEWRR